MADIDVSLKQQSMLGAHLKIKLIDGRELQIQNKNKKREQNYSVDILSLQDKSKKIIYIAWKWLFASISVFFFMLLLLKFLPLFLEGNKNIFLGFVLLLGVLGSIIYLFKFWKYSTVKQVFYSRNAHVPIIILNAGKPTKKSFLSFIHTVEKRIKKFREHMDIDEEKQLTGEMKMLRRLSDDGIISKKDYEKAKPKLLKGFDSSLINRNNN